MAQSVKEVLGDYKKELIENINKIDEDAFQKIIDILLEAYKNDKNVFIMGNGGSAGTANHFVCDFGKNAVAGDYRRYRIMSLCDNVEKITALGNDIAFDEIFRQQLKNLMHDGDVVIAVSASGNSPDLTKALEYAKEKNGKIIALAGFKGGKIKEMSDVSLVAEMESYERIEDMHLMFLHMIVCWMKVNQNVLQNYN